MAIPTPPDCNFTRFLEDHPKCLVVSDLEGLAPKKQIDTIVEAVEAGTKGGVIYLGDLLDYTTVSGLDETIIKKDNLCQFKLLKLFTDNPAHCRCILGNRELNKIKLWPLLQLKSGTKWWHKYTFGKSLENIQVGGNLNDTAKNTILKIANSLNLGNNLDNWKIEDLSPFCPYWKYDKDKDKGKQYQPWLDKQKANIEYDKSNTETQKGYYDRYLSIFGFDNGTEGTISAQNTLKYLLIDLGITDDDIHTLVFKTTEKNNKIGTISGISKFSDKEINALLLLTKEELKDKITVQNKKKLEYELAKLNANLKELNANLEELKKSKEDIKKVEGDIKKVNEQIFFLNIELKVLETSSSAEGIRSTLKSKYDLMAKVVFTVYARMLDPELAKNPKILEIDGLLYKYYKQALCIGYATKNNNLYLFSHGGITTDFITTKTQGYELLEKMGDELVHICKTDSQAADSQAGGGGSDTNNLTIPKKLHTKINLFNRQILVYIGQIFNNTYEGNIQVYLSVLIAMSVPSHFNPIIRESGYKTEYSPNQIGADPNSNLDSISELEKQKKIFITKNKFNFKKIVNFFGHIPKGFGYSFGKAGGSQNTYYVSTDFSNTMFKSPLLDSKTYNDNYLVLQLNITNGEMSLAGDIKLDISKFKKIISYKSPHEINEALTQNLLFIPDRNEDGLNITFKNELIDFESSNNKENGTNIFYNGIGKLKNKDKDKPYKIFTKIELPPNFNKALILVREDIMLTGHSNNKLSNETILTQGGNRKSKKTRKHKRTRKHIRKQKNTRKH